MWEEDPSEAGAAMARHEALLGALVAKSNGQVVKGTGDGVLAVFESANDAVAAAVRIQLDLQRDESVAVRIGIHTGEAEMRRGDYYGTALNRCNRVMDAAHGGQTLLTLATEEVLSRPLPGGVTLLDLGSHRLRDLPEPLRLFQVVHPRLPSDFPPLRGSDAYNHNLPVQLTSFVGRERELALASDLLGESRVVTLTGVGGGGKSRLALQVAADLLERFPSGAWFVELAFAEEPAAVARMVAQAVGVPEEPGRGLLDSVAMRLRQAPALLVLDNCEHVLEACAQAIDHLLRAAPPVKVLATSRERLGVPGEAVYVIPPMSVPSQDESRSADLALRHDAIKLFAQRARLAAPDFRVTDENCTDVGHICRAVDGIPLAIELAAGKVGTLTVQQIAARLGGKLEILGGGSRTGESRHQTMLATLDWSYDLLSPSERQVLAELAAFSGSFDLSQVESVCSADGEDPEILDLVLALLEKSLVARDPTTGRYRLLEPVRRYAGDKLAETGRQEEMAQRHARLFADVVEELSGGAEGTRPPGWLDRLELEHDNVRAALRWSLEHEAADLALRIAGATWTFWKLRGHLTEGRSWLEQALEAAHEPEPSVLASALRGAGSLAASLGDDERAREHLQRSLELAEQLGDDAGVRASLSGLAVLPYLQGDPRETTRLLEEQLQSARRAADPSRLGHILASLALLSEDQGHTTKADEYAAEALEVRHETDDLYVATDALLAQGEISINRGDWDLAHRVLDEALTTARSAGFTEVICWATAYLGKLALGEGRVEDGERLLSESLAMFQRLELAPGEAWAMRHLGRAALAEGDDSRARALLSTALRIALDQVRPDAPLVLQALGELGARGHDPEAAAVLLGAAQAARQRMGLGVPLREQRIAEEAEASLRGRIGDDRFEELTARGAAMTLEEAAELASR